MTATDELRRLLDERGVEHFDGTETTLWGHEPTGNGTGVYRIMADEVSNGRLVVRMLFKTPEQAIEATLGRGTCHPIISDNLTDATEIMRLRDVLESYAKTFDGWAAENNGGGRQMDGPDWLELANELRMERDGI